MRVLHILKHVEMGGITRYVLSAMKEMRSSLDYAAVVSGGGEMSAAFHEIGVETFELPIAVKSVLHPQVWRSIAPLVKIVTEQRIDVIHAHTRVGQVMAAVVSRKTGVPVVTTCHGFFTRNIGRRLFPAWGDTVIAISDAVREELRTQWRVPDVRIKTIYNGVDCAALEDAAAHTDRACARKQCGVPADVPVIGIVSRIVQDKGFICLVDAFAEVKKRHPDSILLIAGEGKYKDAVVAHIAARSLSDSVVFLGVQQSIATVLLSMDIVVLPTLTREGFGLSVVEAMALKRPVIVSDLGGLRTVVNDNETGLLFPPGDSQVLAQKIQYVLADPHVYERLQDAGYCSAKTQFTSVRMAEEMCAVYRDLMRRG